MTLDGFTPSWVSVWFGAAVLGWTAAKMIASEPLLSAWLAAYPAARSAIYVVIIGGLVAVPMWRVLSPQQRATGAVLAFLAVWLTFWGWIDDTAGIAFDPIDG